MRKEIEFERQLRKKAGKGDRKNEHEKELRNEGKKTEEGKHERHRDTETERQKATKQTSKQRSLHNVLF
jgi:hypothetical protein